ncbi:cdkn1a interacting zinc finger protein 1b [Pholidichthys leucotaenia]
MMVKEPQRSADRTEESPALTNRERVCGPCDPAEAVPPPEQQGAAESNSGRAAELQGVEPLKVTIQQSSQSREFRRTDGRTGDGQPGGHVCHVCEISCGSVEVFEDHMSGPEHLQRLQQITQSISTTTLMLKDRGCGSDKRRWCDMCQTHFSGDVIIHRRTEQHKVCKQQCRPFCPVCQRHFRTPRKFVEHMKSAEHKHKVQQQEVQEEELITVDAVGCFEEEEEEEEEEVDVEDGDGGGPEQTRVSETADGKEHDPNDTYGSGFVVPVCGFVCRLCNKFFYSENLARHKHCRTQTHCSNLQTHLSGRKRIRMTDEDSVSQNASEPWGDDVTPPSE